MSTSEVPADGSRQFAIRLRARPILLQKKQIGMKAKPYQKGDRIPVRYLKEAPFAAECADHESFWPWLGALIVLLFPATMLFWYLTGE